MNKQQYLKRLEGAVECLTISPDCIQKAVAFHKEHGITPLDCLLEASKITAKILQGEIEQ